MGMNFDEIIQRFKDACFSMSENMKIKEPDMRLIIDEVDDACHSIRREFERYDDECIFEIGRVYKCLDRIERVANKIDDYEEEMAEEE